MISRFVPSLSFRMHIFEQVCVCEKRKNCHGCHGYVLIIKRVAEQPVFRSFGEFPVFCYGNSRLTHACMHTV